MQIGIYNANFGNKNTLKSYWGFTSSTCFVHLLTFELPPLSAQEMHSAGGSGDGATKNDGGWNYILEP